MNMSKVSNKTEDNLKNYDFVSGEEDFDPNAKAEREKAGFENQEENEMKAFSKVLKGKYENLILGKRHFGKDLRYI